MNQKIALTEPLLAITRNVNALFGKKEPWHVATISATTALTLVWLWNFLNQDESIYKRGKKKFFKLVRYIPAVRRQIDAELTKAENGFVEDTKKRTTGLDYVTKLPFQALTHEEVLAAVDKHLALGHYKWDEGRVSGTVYNYDEKLVNLITTVYGRTSYTNPLHSDVFPGICKLEAEVVRMTATLFSGDSDACGTVIKFSQWRRLNE